MRALTIDYALAFIVLVSIFSSGCALVSLTTRLTGIDLLGFGAAAGVAIEALFGIGIALVPAARAAFVVSDAVLAIGALAWMWRAGVFHTRLGRLRGSMLVALALWLGFIAICIALTHLEVVLPEHLPDGRYVFKGPTENVKLQFLTTQPADNTIPYIVGEYLLRGVSFHVERPILPGNEISNRTILMSLAAVPYRAAVSPPPRWNGPLGTFEYVGRQWPAVERLYDDPAYRQILVVGIILNALLLLGALVVFQRHAIDGAVLPCAMLIAWTNPYLLSQIVFLWPKALAGFFLLLAWQAARRGYSPVIVGVCAALAYHSHPYAGIFAAALALAFALRCAGSERPFQKAFLFTATFALLVLPWFIWTRILIGAPSNLLWQNFAGPGTETAMSSTLNFVWERVINLFEIACPIMFGVYPFDFERVVDLAQACLPGAVGLCLIVPAAARAFAAIRNDAFARIAIALPALSTVLLFSYRARPIVHGFQPLVALLLVAGVINLRRFLPAPWYWGCVTLQILANLTLLWMRAALTGAHFA